MRLQQLVVDNWLAMQRNIVDIVDTAADIVARPWDMSCYYPRAVH